MIWAPFLRGLSQSTADAAEAAKTWRKAPLRTSKVFLGRSQRLRRRSMADLRVQRKTKPPPDGTLWRSFLNQLGCLRDSIWTSALFPPNCGIFRPVEHL